MWDFAYSSYNSADVFHHLPVTSFSPFCHWKIRERWPTNMTELEREHRNKTQRTYTLYVWKKGEKKRKRTYLPFCFPVLSTTERKMKGDRGCFHSFRYWIWFGAGGGRVIMCLGLKSTLSSSLSEGCPGVRAGQPMWWQACDVSEGDPIAPDALPCPGAGGRRLGSVTSGKKFLTSSHWAGLNEKSCQCCWANLGEPRSLVSRAQGSK